MRLKTEDQRSKIELGPTFVSRDQFLIFNHQSLVFAGILALVLLLAFVNPTFAQEVPADHQRSVHALP